MTKHNTTRTTTTSPRTRRSVMMTAALCLMALCWSTAASAQSFKKDEHRTISVSGQAEIKVVPDEFVITFGVETHGKTAKRAKEQNDARTAKLLKAARSFGVAPKYLRTDDFTISARYTGRYDNRRLDGYNTTRRIVIILHDAKKLEPMLTSLFEKGANRLHSVTFHTTKIIELREKARLLALKAAKKKAGDMAGALGAQVGIPLRISESRFQSHAVNNFVYTGGRARNIGSTIAAGKVSVRASVDVLFELR